MNLPSLGDLVVIVVAVTIVTGFFLATRHFIRQAERNVKREDGTSVPASRGHEKH